MLVGNLTFGIYTPMHIKVTCAASRTDLLYNELNMLKLDKKGSEETIQQTFTTAAEQAYNSGQPVYVDFR